MLKQIIHDNFITDLIQFNHKSIIMFLNSLKFINDIKNLITFMHVYCETLINFIKIYEKKS